MNLENMLHLCPTGALWNSISLAMQTSGCLLKTLFAAGKIIEAKCVVPKKSHECQHCDLADSFSKLHLKLDKISYKLDKYQLNNSNVTNATTGTVTDTERSLNLFDNAPSLNGVVDFKKFNVSIASFVYMWYTLQPWLLSRNTKEVSTLFSDMVSRLAILKMTAKNPIFIQAAPSTHVQGEYSNWKSMISNLGLKLQEDFNNVIGAIDGKSASQAGSIRTRFSAILKNYAGAELNVLFLKFKTKLESGDIIDLATPKEHDSVNKLLQKCMLAVV